MKYKVGDKVKVKSLEWYNKNKNESGIIKCGRVTFVSSMKIYLGTTLTIDKVNLKDEEYRVNENDWFWSNEMFEDKDCFNEKEIKIPIPEGYVFGGLDYDNSGKICVVFEKE